jgi:uncharacterized protein YbjT (DUF2867 family)
VARALIVGCGCRGLELGRELVADGWLVRGTSRDPARLEAISAAGLEGALADPDRPGSVLELCGDVAMVVWLLGSAAGDAELLQAIHGPRLERLLEKLVDTPVRGFAYEAVGTAPSRLLTGGREIVERAAATWRIPVAFVELSPGQENWAREVATEVVGLLAA